MRLSTSFEVAQLDSNLPGEDRFQILVRDGLQAFGVFDGHGGYLAADVTVGALLSTIFDNILLLTTKTPENIAHSIDVSFCSIDEYILQQAIEINDIEKSIHTTTSETSSGVTKHKGFAGCCVVVVLFVDSYMYVAHVGDCRALMIEEKYHLLNDTHTNGLYDMPTTDIYKDNITPNSSSTFNNQDHSKKPSSSIHNMTSSSSSSSSSSLYYNNNSMKERNHMKRSGISSSSSSSSSSSIMNTIPSTKCNGYLNHTFDISLDTIDYSTQLPLIRHIDNVNASSSSSSDSGSGGSKGTIQSSSSTCMSSSSSSTTILMNKKSMKRKYNTLIPSQYFQSNNGTNHHHYNHSIVNPHNSSNCDLYNSGSNSNKSKIKQTCPSSSSSTFIPSAESRVHMPTASYYSIKALTQDHNCKNSDERKLVKRLTTDINPLRPGPRDPSLRVGGSLAITRALGDGYLKKSSLSIPNIKDHVPYITCHPTVSYRPLTINDKMIILSSDGIWDYIDPEKCLKILTSSSSSTTTTTTTTTTAISSSSKSSLLSMIRTDSVFKPVVKSSVETIVHPSVVYFTNDDTNDSHLSTNSYIKHFSSSSSSSTVSLSFSPRNSSINNIDNYNEKSLMPTATCISDTISTDKNTENTENSSICTTSHMNQYMNYKWNKINRHTPSPPPPSTTPSIMNPTTTIITTTTAAAATTAASSHLIVGDMKRVMIHDSSITPNTLNPASNPIVITSHRRNKCIVMKPILSENSPLDQRITEQCVLSSQQKMNRHIQPYMRNPKYMTHIPNLLLYSGILSTLPVTSSVTADDVKSTNTSILTKHDLSHHTMCHGYSESREYTPEEDGYTDASHTPPTHIYPLSQSPITMKDEENYCKTLHSHMNTLDVKDNALHDCVHTTNNQIDTNTPVEIQLIDTTYTKQDNKSWEVIVESIDQASKILRMNPLDMIKMPQGNTRRGVLDDMTVMIITLHHHDI